jgi:hypothetical protein
VHKRRDTASADVLDLGECRAQAAE